MKYICNHCGKQYPACIVEVIGMVPEPPYSCLYAEDAGDMAADWKEMKERDFEMNGLCSDCSNNCSNICSNCKDANYFEQNRKAATPQQPPTGYGDMVLPEFIKDVYARADAGHKKYGTYLMTNNSRDALLDAYQECLDMGMYLKQVMMESEIKNDLESKIKQWAEERGLYESGTWVGQLNKLCEEMLEWQNAMLSKDRKEEMLEIGDMFVVLVNLANIRGFSLMECGWAAYNKIKYRTGLMKNGTFVKDQK